MTIKSVSIPQLELIKAVNRAIAAGTPIVVEIPPKT